MTDQDQRAQLEQGITRNARHIFREAEGHFSDDTPTHRQLFIDTAINPTHYLGGDRYKTDWYAQTLATGEQIWVQVRNGEIRNAGINPVPKRWSAETGLAGLP